MPTKRQTAAQEAWERALREKAQKEKDRFHKARRREIAEGKRTNGATANKKKNKHGRRR